MNKIKSLVLAAIGLLCSLSVSAEDFEVDGIYYNIISSTEKTVEVTFRGAFSDSYDEYSGAVSIPEYVTYNGNTYSVTSIRDYAFVGCSGLTSVEISNSVTSIGNRAFLGCSGLTSVEIPNSVTSIGEYAFSGTAWYKNQPDGVVYLDNYLLEYKGTMPSNISIEVKDGTLLIANSAFYNCSSLISVVIPNSVTSIGRWAFGECSGLTSVEIPNSVTSIGDRAFYGCTGLTSLVIPNSVTNIGNYAFYGCYSLTSVEIPNSVTSIGSFAFSHCSGLTSVEIPNSVTSIGSSAFSYCSGLTSVVIPNSVTSIGSSAFHGCSNLTSVEIPNSVTSIGDYAFNYCSGLTSVEIGNGVTSIGNYAFEGCYSLTSVVIPNSVTSIGFGAFAGCSNLTSVEIPNSVTSIGFDVFYSTAWYNNQSDGVVYLGNYLLDYKGMMSSNTSIEIKEGTFMIAGGAFQGRPLTSVMIPNSVTSIGPSAFAHCSGLTSVVIPNSVTSIGRWAFGECSGLTSITSLVPAEKLFSPGDSAFEGVDKTSCTLYVPMGAKETYAATGGWNEFVNIEELAPSHYELTDGEEYNETFDMTVETVTYTRTLPNLHWNALYVPFELPYDVVADRYDVAYINDVNGYDTDDNGTIDDLAMEIIKIKGGTLKANYPYLIKAKTEADKAMSITVEDATLYAAAENSVDCSSVYQNYAVTGIYTKKTAEELAGNLAISTSGAWQPLAAGTALNPFRLYLSIENLDDSPLKVETSAMSRMRIVEYGETTGVETITPAQQREDVIIDLSGRRVKQPVKGGIYIVNGKKRIF